jgi:dihydroflavonol-4-reductase
MDLVIGGSGFIGSHLVGELLQRGRAVRVYDLQPFPQEDHGLRPAETVVGDILDLQLLSDAMGGCDRVFHLAGNPQLWDRRPRNFDRVNRRGTENVLLAARQADVRMLVYTGTETILAPRRHHGPIREETQSALRDMIGPYCRSKFLAQQAVLQAARSGLPALVVVPTLPIGPGDRNLTPPGRMISDFLQGKIPGYIDCTLNFVDVRDAALGHVFAAENGEPGRRYILSGHNLTLAEFFCYLSRESSRPPPRHRVPYVVALAWSCVEEWMGKLTGRTPQSSVTGVRLCRRSLAFDGTRTWQLLGHSPRPVEESIRDAVLWHQRRLSPATGTR